MDAIDDRVVTSDWTVHLVTGWNMKHGRILELLEGRETSAAQVAREAS